MAKTKIVDYHYDTPVLDISVVLYDNPSGIYPTEYKVLVRPEAIEEKTKGGIIIPDATKERMQFATMRAVVIAVSPIAFNYDDKLPDDAKAKPGDRVIVAKYAGVDADGADGVPYRLVNDKDVCAILR